ncbi:unnamed protein product [Urochloa decumbens]|uniref:BAG domain-containing protein n=1 Tax=Urochloa decumbens TaxID=240449 RepID=A0ABC9H3M9_9POAL
MASRRASSYDPYAYHHAAPSYRYTYLYDDPYGSQRRRPAATYGHIYDCDDPHHAGRSRPRGSRRAGDSFPAAWHAAAESPEAEEPGAAPANPIQIEGLEDPEPEREAAERRAGQPPAPAVAVPVNRSAEEAAAVRVQAAARGFLARRSVRAVRRVEREAGAVDRLVRDKAEALRANARARLAAGEVLMKMVLRLDAVRGAREYRRRVTRRVLALQDAVDALDPNAPPAPDPEAASTPAKQLDENGGDTGSENAVDAHGKMEMEVDANVDDGDTEGPDAEGEWEMVVEEPTAAAAVCPEAPRLESSGQNISAAPDGVDVSKLMEMVATLCEQNAQQRAVITALAERVDALERTVPQMEAAER